LLKAIEWSVVADTINEVWLLLTNECWC